MRWVGVALTFLFLLPSAMAVCPALTPANVVITFTDDTATCSIAQHVCPLGHQVTFTAATSGYSFDCGPHTFSWNFGDGTSLSAGAATATHAFTGPGVYGVTLKIQSPTSSISVGQTVLAAVADPASPVPPPPPAPPDPKATFAVDQLSGLEFAFRPAVSDASIAYMLWNFGDGVETNASYPFSPPSHRYDAAGKYTVTLIVVTTDSQVLYASGDVIATAARQRAARH